MPLNVLSLIIGYLLGSIPTAFILSRVSRGIDIRTIGSRNIGGANVMREIGIGEGVFVGLFFVLGQVCRLLSLVEQRPDLG